MKTWLIILTIVSNSFFAHAEEGVTSITKGTPAPYDGVLLNNDKANQLRKDLLDLDTEKELNKSLQRSMDFYKIKDEYSSNQINILLEQNMKLNGALNSELNNDKYQNLLWFSLGVLATGLSVYAAQKIIQP